MAAPENFFTDELKIFGLRIGDAGFIKIEEILKIEDMGSSAGERGSPDFPGPVREMRYSYARSCKFSRQQAAFEENFFVEFDNEKIDENFLNKVGREL